MTMLARCTEAIALALGCVGADASAAQSYPVCPIRVIVPSQAGGGADIVARAIAAKMSEAWREQVVVDNRIGVVGEEIAAKAQADGHTLLFTTSSLAIRESVFSNLPYNTLRDFVPVSQAVMQPNLLVTHPSVPAKTVSEQVALARAKPGEFNYGSGGAATSNHLAGELFRLLARVRVVHVPYKGVPAALTDTIAGRMHFAFGSPVSTLQHVKDHRLRLIAVITAQRISSLTEVPAIAESLPGYEFTGWMSLLAPAGTPHAAIERLHAEVSRIVYLQDVRQRFLADAAEPVGSSPEAFRAFLSNEISRWSRVAREADIRAE
ncbi:MAG: tripartite tricarboxylate transporter substrate binding protein [Methanocella sp.]